MLSICGIANCVIILLLIGFIAPTIYGFAYPKLLAKSAQAANSASVAKHADEFRALANQDAPATKEKAKL